MLAVIVAPDMRAPQTQASSLGQVRVWQRLRWTVCMGGEEFFQRHILPYARWGLGAHRRGYASEQPDWGSFAYFSGIWVLNRALALVEYA